MAIGGRDMAAVKAYRRPVNIGCFNGRRCSRISMSHENVAFGLRVDRLPKEEVDERVGWALELVRMPGYEARSASELLGRANAASRASAGAGQASARSSAR